MDRIRNQPEYTVDENRYFLRDERNNIIISTEEIWLMVEVDSFVVHAHGSKENVLRRFNNFQTKLMKGAQEATSNETKELILKMCEHMVMLDITKVPLEEVNRILSTSGYVKKVLIEYGIVSEPKP